MRTSALSGLAALAGSVLATTNSTAASDIAWKNLSISAPAVGRYLYRTESGEPFFWQADTAWELLHRLNKSDVEYYLQDRAAKGFNVIQAVVLSELNGTSFPNFYGEVAINNADPTQPNEAYFEYVDWVVERAAEYGILIAMVPTWGRWVNCGWHNGDVIFNETSAEWYGRYIGQRYPGLPKIIGADSNGWWTCNMSAVQDTFRDDPSVDPATLMGPITDTRAVWASMVKGLKEAEDAAGFDAFVTWHPANMWVVRPEETPAAFGHNFLNGTLSWNVSMDAIQSGHALADIPGVDIDAGLTVTDARDCTINYEYVAEMRAAFPGPVIDLENHYEGMHININASKGIWNASEVRHGLYSAVLSGAAGFTYGANAVWQMYAPEDELARSDLYYDTQCELNASDSWRNQLVYPGSVQAGYVKALFDGLGREAYAALQPNRSFISTPAGAAWDVLSYSANRYLAGLLGQDRYFVYAGYGDAFDLDLAGLASRFGTANATAQWYDPRSGSYSAAVEVELVGRKTFEPVTSGGVDFDWVLLVKAA